jgi:hypothetical protein
MNTLMAIQNHLKHGIHPPGGAPLDFNTAAIFLDYMQEAIVELSKDKDFFSLEDWLDKLEIYNSCEDWFSIRDLDMFLKVMRGFFEHE